MGAPNRIVSSRQRSAVLTMTSDEVSEMPDGLPTDLDPDQRAGLTKMVIQLFDQWGIDIGSQSALLGLSLNSPITIVDYRSGAALSDGRDLMDRVGNLLGIHRSLRLLFPQNRELVYRWLTVPNLAFDNRSPVEIMVERGLPGIVTVRGYLDVMSRT